MGTMDRSNMDYLRKITVVMLIFTLKRTTADQKTQTHVTHVTCLPANAPTKLYLECPDNGVLNLLQVLHTKRIEETCSVGTSSNCPLDALDRHDILRLCSGRSKCVVTVTSLFLSACRTMSDMMIVEYQCVAAGDGDDTHTIIDSCGEDMDDKPIHRTQGYIESPNYPDPYPLSVSCQCTLSVKTGSYIHLQILDVQLHSKKNRSCTDDWAEYKTLQQPWNGGVKLCGVPRGHSIIAPTPVVHVDFHSDNAVSSRGFWVEYKGFSKGKKKTPVTVQCGTYQVDNTASEEFIQQESNDIPGVNSEAIGSTSQNQATVNLGLAVGLSLAAVWILLLGLTLGLFLYRRSARKLVQSRSSPSPENDEPTTPLDSSYTALRKYSTMASSKLSPQSPPYTSLDSKQHQPDEPDNVYDYITDENVRTASDSNDVHQTPNHPAAYDNPVYDSSADITGTNKADAQMPPGGHAVKPAHRGCVDNGTQQVQDSARQQDQGEGYGVATVPPDWNKGKMDTTSV